MRILRNSNPSATGEVTTALAMNIFDNREVDSNSGQVAKTDESRHNAWRGLWRHELTGGIRWDASIVNLSIGFRIDKACTY